MGPVCPAPAGCFRTVGRWVACRSVLPQLPLGGAPTRPLWGAVVRSHAPFGAPPCGCTLTLGRLRWFAGLSVLCGKERCCRFLAAGGRDFIA